MLIFVVLLIVFNSFAHPIALALGSGAELLQPLAIAVIGDLAVALLFSLVVTPTVYAMSRSNEVRR